MEEEYGWGTGSTVAILIVAAIILFAPLGMGPVEPPSAFVILIVPVIIIAVLYFLHQAANSSDD